MPLNSGYAVQSDVDETASIVVTSTISRSTADGEVPQQQCVVESQGGGDQGQTVIDSGISIQVNTSVSGADATAGITGV